MTPEEFPAPLTDLTARTHGHPGNHADDIVMLLPADFYVA
jgi:hypothetical protein